MTQRIEIEENGLHVVIDIDEEGDVRLLHFSPHPLHVPDLGDVPNYKWYRLVEVAASGEDTDDHHGAKHTGTLPGARLRYCEHRDDRNAIGRKIEIEQADSTLDGGERLRVVSHMQFYDGIPVVRAWTEVRNVGEEAVGLEYVSSFALTGLAKEGVSDWAEKSRLHVPHNGWFGECQWGVYALPQLGLSRVYSHTIKRLSYGSAGTWPTKEFLPMGGFENVESRSFIFWQIEANSGWHWEVGDLTRDQIYLRLSGPTEAESHWWKNLTPGETFCSEPVAVGAVEGDRGLAFAELTRYRRAIRRPCEDNRLLPIIFNDYMNCLNADPTTEKELPLIEAAREAGCEYYVIDAGWYDDGVWWYKVGEWLPAATRFPDGLPDLIERIRAAGMIPGLWLEIEVVGVQSPVAGRLPDECFFMRHGKRVIDHGRYQLDFRHPRVIEHANEVMDRLVQEYGVGYIKIDYNIDAGIGTEVASDSFGDGLLGHTRAYLAWIDNVLERYPDLVLENCGSGGLRMDYAMLANHAIQSTSDQNDYRLASVIAAAAPTAATPEQGAVWSYPLEEADAEEVIFNMVNAMLGRVQQSGRIDCLSPELSALLKEGLDYYKTVREEIPESVPFWPIGLPWFGCGWAALGLRGPKRTLLAVWRLGGDDQECLLAAPHLEGKSVFVRCAYPTTIERRYVWDSSGKLGVVFPKQYTAAVFEFEE